jgi:hypothetical protein
METSAARRSREVERQQSTTYRTQEARALGADGSESAMLYFYKERFKNN